MRLVRSWLHGRVQSTPESPDRDESQQAAQPGYPQPQTGCPPAHPQVGEQPGSAQQAGALSSGYPVAPRLTELGDSPAGRPHLPIDSALRLVFVLMFVNLGLSLVTSVLTLILHTSVIDYQIAHTAVAANPTIQREALEVTLWTKLIVSLAIAGLYLWRAFALRRGSRRAYLRLFYIAIVGIIGIGYVIIASQYPVWMRVEQIIQAIVLVGLLVAISRPQVRDRFSKKPRPS